MSNQVQSRNAKQKVEPVLCKKFDIDRFSFTDLERNNERTTTQMIAYPRYKYERFGETTFLFQFPEITITNYGLPSNKSEFYQDDKQRAFVKLPFDEEQDGCIKLMHMLEEIDVYTEKNKSSILGQKYARHYKYMPIVREPQQKDELDDLDDDDDDKKSKKSKYDDEPRPKYCKVRFDLTYPDKEIKTEVYIKDPQNLKAPPNKFLAKTASDLDEYLRWGCKVRGIVMANKLWAAKNKNDDGVRKYGVALKFTHLEITPRENSGSITEFIKGYAFVNEDDDEEVNEKGESENEDSDEDSDEDTDEDTDEDSDKDTDSNNELDDGLDEDSEEASEEASEEEPEKKPEEKPRKGRKKKSSRN